MEFTEATAFTFTSAVVEQQIETVSVYLHCPNQNSAGHVLQETQSLLNQFQILLSVIRNKKKVS